MRCAFFSHHPERSAFFLNTDIKPSSLEGKVFYERVDPARLDYVIKRQRHEPTLEPWEIRMLMRMSDRVDRRTQLLKVTNSHTRKRSHSLGDQGRLYPKPWQGATALHREERYYVFQESMVDVDAYFNHLSIFLNLATLDGFSLPAISNLITRREFIVGCVAKAAEMDVSDVKELVNAMLFGFDIVQHFIGSLWSKHSVPVPIPTEIIKAQSEIRKVYCHIRAVNSELLSTHKMKASSLVARICEIHETVLLEQILEFAYKTGCADRNIPIVSLQHDGLMLAKNEKLNEKWLRQLEEFVWDKTGFAMHYRFKTMNVKTRYH